jgi:hypothetical protein
VRSPRGAGQGGCQGVSVWREEGGGRRVGGQEGRRTRGVGTLDSSTPGFYLPLDARTEFVALPLPSFFSTIMFLLGSVPLTWCAATREH